MTKPFNNKAAANAVSFVERVFMTCSVVRLKIYRWSDLEREPRIAHPIFGERTEIPGEWLLCHVMRRE